MDMDLNIDGIFPDTDIFIVGENSDFYHHEHEFVSIDAMHDDHNNSIMIDFSGDEISGAITIDPDFNPDSFVSLDSDVFVSDFPVEDHFIDIIELDASNDMIIL